jgi:hypothetical protein
MATVIIAQESNQVVVSPTANQTVEVIAPGPQGPIGATGSRGGPIAATGATGYTISYQVNAGTPINLGAVGNIFPTPFVLYRLLQIYLALFFVFF